MRIAIDARYLNEHLTPLGQYCENLIEHLSLVDTENEYFIFTHVSFPKRLFVGQNFTVRAVRSHPISLATLYRLDRQLERINPRILHVLYPIVPPRYGGRVVATVHDVKTMLLDQTTRGFHQIGAHMAQAFTRWMFPRAIRRADVIACVSHATRRNLADLMPETLHRSLVIHSGLEPSYLPPLDSTTVDLVLAKHRPPKRFLYYTGPVRPAANLPNMLSAFAQLRNDDAFSTLHFVIDSPGGRALHELQRLVGRMGLREVVRFYENIADSERRVFYDQSEALCFLARNEGFGFPILQAQATATPVLAADSGALPEIAGAGALLVDCDSIPAITEGMRRILSDEALRADLILSGQKNVKKFQWKKTAEQVRDIYNFVF